MFFPEKNAEMEPSEKIEGGNEKNANVPGIDWPGDVRENTVKPLSFATSCVLILRLFYTILFLAKGRKNFQYVDSLFFLLASYDYLVVYCDVESIVCSHA